MKKLIISTIALVVGVFLLYLATLPNINTGYADSDEFIAVAHMRGVAHPPGYPLYTMLAIAFGELPIPFLSYAGKINLLSAVLHALTVGNIFLSAYMLIRKIVDKNSVRLVIALIGAVSLAVTFSFWFYALFAEVFPLNNFLCSLVLFLVVWWDQRREREHDTTWWKSKTQLHLLAAVAVYGLALGNHQIAILLLPAFSWWVLSRERIILFDWKYLLRAIAILVFFYAIAYVYLPIAARNEAVINWENPHDWYGIMRSVTRRTFADNDAEGSAYLNVDLQLADIVGGSQDFFTFVNSNYTIGFLLAALFGAVLLFKEKAYRLLTFLLLGVLGGGWFFAVFFRFKLQPTEIYFEMIRGIHERFYLVALLFLPLLVSLCIGYIYSRLHVKQLFTLIVTGAFFYIAFMMMFFFQELKNNDFTLAHKVAKTTLESMQKNSLFICYNDQSCFSSWYLQEVEGIRTDITVITSGVAVMTPDQLTKHYPHIIKKPLARTYFELAPYFIKKLLEWNVPERPVYVSALPTLPAYLAANGLQKNPYQLVPNGCVYKVQKEFAIPEFNKHCVTLYDEVVDVPLSTRNLITHTFKAQVAGMVFVNTSMFHQQGCMRAMRKQLDILANIKKILPADVAQVHGQLQRAALPKEPAHCN